MVPYLCPYFRNSLFIVINYDHILYNQIIIEPENPAEIRKIRAVSGAHP